MKIFPHEKYRGYLCGCGLFAVLLSGITGITGCGSKSEATASTPETGTTAQNGSAQPAGSSDAEMRKSFSQKTFDINNVPAKDRERVRAIMESQQNRTK